MEMSSSVRLIISILAASRLLEIICQDPSASSDSFANYPTESLGIDRIDPNGFEAGRNLKTKVAFDVEAILRPSVSAVRMK
jgi:hypothetical protein